MYLSNRIYKRLSETKKKNPDRIEEVRIGQQQRMIPYGFFDGLNEERYGNLNEDLENWFTFGNNNSPNDVQAAYEYATNYKNINQRVMIIIEEVVMVYLLQLQEVQEIIIVIIMATIIQETAGVIGAMVIVIIQNVQLQV